MRYIKKVGVCTIISFLAIWVASEGVSLKFDDDTDDNQSFSRWSNQTADPIYSDNFSVDDEGYRRCHSAPPALQQRIHTKERLTTDDPVQAIVRRLDVENQALRLCLESLENVTGHRVVASIDAQSDKVKITVYKITDDDQTGQSLPVFVSKVHDSDDRT